MSKPVEMIDFLVDGSKTPGQTDTKTDVDNCLSGVTHHEKFQVSRHSGDLPICTEISLPLLRFFFLVWDLFWLLAWAEPQKPILHFYTLI